MSILDVPPPGFALPPSFSASWVGRDPRDNQPRVVHCFGPSEPDDYAPVQAGILGLESLRNGHAPHLTQVWAELDPDDSLVFRARHYDGSEFEALRTGRMSESMINVLRWHPEILLTFVDVPLENPVIDIVHVGVEHIWTGTVAVREPGPAPDFEFAVLDRQELG